MKPTHPYIAFVVLLAVADEDVVVISRDEAGHGRRYNSVG